MNQGFFNEGKTPLEFIESFNENQAKFNQLMQESELDENLHRQIECSSAIKYVLVIAEPWSGDVLYNLPPLLQLAKECKWEVRIFNRDQYPELILPYRKEGYFHSIPVFVFYDKDFNELANWIERPELVTRVMDEEQKKLRRSLRETHKDEWRDETFKEIISITKTLK